MGKYYIARVQGNQWSTNFDQSTSTPITFNLYIRETNLDAAQKRVWLWCDDHQIKDADFDITRIFMFGVDNVLAI